MASIRDIARIAGASPASVSRILNNDPTFHINAEDPVKDQNILANYGAVIIEGQITPAAIKHIQSINPNTIFIDVNTNIFGCNIVRNDFIEEITYILDTLYNLGHKNIVYIGGKSEIIDLTGNIVSKQNDLRENGYIGWMKMHNLDKYCKSFITDWSTASALEAGKKILQLKDRPTAVIVGSDPMALGVYKAFNDAGINIPNDISIVSFDDVGLNRYLTPTLSSVYMNTNEMGRIAVRLAKDLITEAVKIPLTITCHSQLNIRDSIISIEKERQIFY